MSLERLQGSADVNRIRACCLLVLAASIYPTAYETQLYEPVLSATTVRFYARCTQAHMQAINLKYTAEALAILRQPAPFAFDFVGTFLAAHPGIDRNAMLKDSAMREELQHAFCINGAELRAAVDAVGGELEAISATVNATSNAVGEMKLMIGEMGDKLGSLAVERQQPAGNDVLDLLKPQVRHLLVLVQCFLRLTRQFLV